MAGLKRFPKEEELFINGVLVLDDDNLKHINNLIKVIYNKHFDLYPQYEDELMSIGMEKAIKMLKSNKFDSSKGSLKNFLYSGIRNDMGNHLYHQKKNVVTDTLPIEQIRATDVMLVSRDDLKRFQKTLPSRLLPKFDLELLYQYITNLGVPTEIQVGNIDYNYDLNKLSIMFLKYYYDNLSR